MRQQDPDIQDSAKAELLTPLTHHPPDIAVSRRLGGGGHLWGGRCVPFDSIDYAPRPWLNLPGWPFDSTEMDDYLADACAELACGAPVFLHGHNVPLSKDSPFTLDRLERWSNQPLTAKLHRAEIAADPDLALVLGVMLTGVIRREDGGVMALRVLSEDQQYEIDADHLVLAMGGVATTQFLLNLQDAEPRLFGGSEGPLGRHYMGHVNGQIADIEMGSEAFHALAPFIQDGTSYLRNRIVPTDDTQAKHRLANIAFWPVVPPIHDPVHRSGILSAIFLALSFGWLGRQVIAEPIRQKHVGQPRYRRLAHLGNVIRDLWSVLSFAPRFLWQRFGAKLRIPGFFLTNPAHRYGLEFHAEHLPDPDSRITLSDECDASGARRARIDFRFSETDAASILRAHDALDEWLRAEGLGQLIYRVPKAGRAREIIAVAKHGNHQIGTIPLGADRATAVVDQWGSVFDIPGLHVASTAILPTSSQATPTLMGVQMALRLADRLAHKGTQHV